MNKLQLILHSEIVNALLLRLGARLRTQLSLPQFDLILAVLDNEIRQEKEIKDIQVEK